MFTPGPTARQDFGFDPRALGSLIVWNDASTYTAALAGGTWSNRSFNPKYSMIYTGTPTYVNAATCGLAYGIHAFAPPAAQKVSPDPYLWNSMTLVMLTRKASGSGRVFQATAGGQNILYGYWSIYKNMLYINGWLSQPNTALDNVWDIYTIRMSEGTGTTFWRNGTQLYSNASGTTRPAMNGLGTNSYGVFSSETSTYQIAEVLLYDTYLTLNDMFALEGYLAWKWTGSSNLVTSLPTTHPFRSNAPTMTLFTPDKFYVTPRLWWDFADQTTYSRITSGKVEFYQTKGSSGVRASYWQNSTSPATTYRGNTVFLPAVGATALNNYSTATFTNNQGLYTSSFAMASNARLYFNVFQALSNISTAANGLTNPLPGFEFFADFGQNQGQTAAGTAGMTLTKTVPGQVAGLNTGPTGISVNVGAIVGNAMQASPTYPIQTGWIIASTIDILSVESNADRVSCFNSLNNPGTQYWTSCNLTYQPVATNFYFSNYTYSYMMLPMSTNQAHHVGMEWAENIIFDTYMTTNDSQKVEGYLGWKYNLQGNFSTTFAFAKLPPALATGFNGTRVNYFGTAQAVTYLPLQTDLIDIGTYPQLVTSNGTLSFTSVGGKTGLNINGTITNFASFSNSFQAPFTICCWIYAAASTAYSPISFTNNLATQPVVQFNVTNNLVAIMATGTQANQLSTAYTYTNAAVNTTTWFSVALVVNNTTSSNGELYVNGTSVQTITGTYPLHSRGVQFYLGRTGDAAGRSFSGNLRHFTLFNKALTSTEVSSWHTNTT